MNSETFPVLAGEHAVDRAARFVGGRPILAKSLGVTAAAIGNWKFRGVPIEMCVPIERATLGVVGRQHLRPDWMDLWPELAEPTTEQSTA
jgi:DNA-binding transcriptional regulator YdaS (Cro superfamily)